jgi:hypothetical protein
VSEVASLLKERKETVSVAETVCCSSLISHLDVIPLCSFWDFPNLWLVTFHSSFTRGILYRSSKGRRASKECLNVVGHLLTNLSGSRWHHIRLPTKYARSKRILQRRFDCMSTSPLSPFTFHH